MRTILILSTFAFLGACRQTTPDACLGLMSPTDGPSNLVGRVFFIHCGPVYGTAFTIDVLGRQYLVTARHVAQAFQGSGTIELYTHGAWKPFPTRLTGHGAGNIDVSVLAVDRLLTRPNMPLTAASKDLIWGQDVFLLGFPLVLPMRGFNPTSGEWPVPFAKKAVASLLDPAAETVLLDGHSNKGMSGGPVVFANRKTDGQFEVAAVISTGLAVETLDLNGQAIPDPVDSNGQQRVYYDAGVVVAYKIDAALELIRANPNGFEFGGV